MSDAASSTPAPARAWRVAPSPWVAAVVFVAYVVLANGVQLASGVPYSEFFASAENAWRSAVLSLAVGGAMLLAFVAWSRWDGIWRDAGRLTMTRAMWIAPAVMIVLMLIRLSYKLSSSVPVDLLFAIVMAGIGVGLVEELLFRGIVLRSLRMHGRSEAWAMLLTSVWFGAMHLTNALLGTPIWAAIFQATIAGITGMTLYQFRRGTGLIVTGMVIHGLWDISAFLPTGNAVGFAGNFELVSLVILPIVGIISGVAVFRHDRQITMTSEGPAPMPKLSPATSNG